MLPRNFEDLTVGERENVIKKKLIDFGKKHKVQQEIQKDEKEFLQNADFDTKKKKLFDVLDQYNLLLTQIFNYFGLLQGSGNVGIVKRFLNADRIPRFYDNTAKLSFLYNQANDLVDNLFKEIKVDDPIFKKLNKKTNDLIKQQDIYMTFFDPRIEAGHKVTDFHRSGMNVNEDDVDKTIYNLLVEGLNPLIEKLKDMLQFLQTTPRSGKGMGGAGLWNIDTTEHLIPHKFM